MQDDLTYQFVDDTYNVVAHRLLTPPIKPPVENIDRPETTQDARQVAVIWLFNYLQKQGVVAQHFEDAAYSTAPSLINYMHSCAIRNIYKHERSYRQHGEDHTVERVSLDALIGQPFEADDRVFFEEPNPPEDQGFIEDMTDEPIDVYGEELARRYRTGSPDVRKAIRLMVQAFAYIDRGEAVPGPLRDQIDRVRRKVKVLGMPLKVTDLR